MKIIFDDDNDDCQACVGWHLILLPSAGVQFIAQQSDSSDAIHIMCSANRNLISATVSCSCPSPIHVSISVLIYFIFLLNLFHDSRFPLFLSTHKFH